MRIEKRYSRYRADSELSRINTAAAQGQSIRIDEETGGRAVRRVFDRLERTPAFAAKYSTSRDNRAGFSCLSSESKRSEAVAKVSPFSRTMATSYPGRYCWLQETHSREWL